MSKDRLDISDNTAISMPVRNMLAIIGAVAIGVWSYFGITEQLNRHSTELELMTRDLEENTEFRIKWPRGEMGSLPADSEQFMLIEDLYKSVEKIEKNLEQNMTNKVNIEFLQKQVEKMSQDIEKLKDANREIVYKNGGTH
tara:strand:- start:1161 stop:1583 length:423 start_codon:yes stop_codon:yes gene_type:complete